MENEIRQRMKEMSDEELVGQFTKHKSEYTGEAAAIMEQEIHHRNLDSVSREAQAGADAMESQQYNREDFVALEHSFSMVDILLAQLVLREEAVPFSVQVPAQASSILPVDGQLMQDYIINVHPDFLQKARDVLGEHFNSVDGRFSRKDMSTIERLRAFSFNEIMVDEKTMAEVVDVTFSAEERGRIATYVVRLIDEVEEVEKKIERLIFYYDNLENVRDCMSGSGSEELTRTDLMTILETLQVYCTETDFPVILESVADAIMAFLQQ